MASASDSTRLPSTGGPVTQAIRAMRNEHRKTLPRRDVLAVAGAALVGTIVGAVRYRPGGPDLGFVAEEWLRDARELGMYFLLGPDGQVWRGTPIYDGSDRAEARERHWLKADNRPRMLDAIRSAVRREAAS